MASFSRIQQGTRATRRVELPVAGLADPVPLLVRPLNGAEEGDVLERARAYAIGKGLAAPKDGERLYDLGLMVNVLALACLDVDAPDRPFFDGADPAAQILSALDADRIALLYEAQQLWQEECSPRKGSMDGAAWIGWVIAAAGAAEGEDPFVSQRPGLRASCMRTLAIQYLALLGRKSGSTSASEAAGSRSTAPSPDAPPAPADDEPTEP